MAFVCSRSRGPRLLGPHGEPPPSTAKPPHVTKPLPEPHGPSCLGSRGLCWGGEVGGLVLQPFGLADEHLQGEGRQERKSAFSCDLRLSSLSRGIASASGPTWRRARSAFARRDVKPRKSSFNHREACAVHVFRMMRRRENSTHCPVPKPVFPWIWGSFSGRIEGQDPNAP